MAAPLVGNWTKTTAAPDYPDTVHFHPDGRYDTTHAAADRHPRWDVGRYEVPGPGRVRVSTSNDAIIEYKFAVSGDAVTFTAPDGTEFRYRKQG